MNSLYHFSQPVLAQSSSGNIENETERERERQEVLWPDTHPKIATVNIHTKNVALSESAKVEKFFHSLSPVFDVAIITRWENVSDFGRKIHI